MGTGKIPESTFGRLHPFGKMVLPLILTGSFVLNVYINLSVTHQLRITISLVFVLPIHFPVK